MKKTVVAGFLFILSGGLGCGVKGRPLPPEHPPFIGRGLVETSTESEDQKLESTMPIGTDTMELNQKEENSAPTPESVKTKEEARKKNKSLKRVKEKNQ